MAFNFHTDFPASDPQCVPRFTRTFEHIDWIDGASVVQAETTPTEEGFNSRFRKIIADLEGLADDARRALLCAAAIRTSIFAILNEAETELTRLGAATEGWHSPTLLNGWSFRALDTDFDYNPPGYFMDKSGMVHLRGTLGNGPIPSSANSFNSVMFQLPAGYRPERRTVLHVLTSGDGMRRLDVNEEGQVILRSAYTTWVSLDGMSFRGTGTPMVMVAGGAFVDPGSVVFDPGGRRPILPPHS